MGIIGTSSQTLKKLEEWTKKDGHSSRFLEFYKRLLHIQARAEGHIFIPKPGLSKKVLSSRTISGLPLLRFNELDLDWPLVEDVFVEVAVAFAGYPELFGEVPQGLIKSGPRPKLPRKVVRTWFEGSSLAAKIAGVDVNKPLLEAIIHATLRPFLTSYSKGLTSLVNQENWHRGYCPVCGGSPDFAYLNKEAGARWLLCSRCGTEWLFQRLECPYCGNKDQTALSYFTDDEALYRLYVCEKCRTYLKAIDLRRTELEVLLPLEPTMTLDMDRQAQEQGYKPGPSKASGMTTPQSEGS